MIRGFRCVVKNITCTVMKGHYREVREAIPMIIEADLPIMHEDVDGGTAVELGTKQVQDTANFGGEIGKHIPIDLEGVGTLMDGHGGRDDWVKLDGQLASNRYRDKVLGREFQCAKGKGNCVWRVLSLQ